MKRVSPPRCRVLVFAWTAAATRRPPVDSALVATPPVATALLAIALVAGWQTPAAAQPTPVAQAAAVVTAPVIESERAASLSFNATIMPGRQVVIGSAVDGRVLEVLVEEGQFVGARQELVKILTKTIGIEIAAAKAALRLREAELKELENGARPQEKERAQAESARAKALWEFALSKLKRVRRLYTESGVATQEELDEAISAEEAARRNFDAQSASLSMLLEGERAEHLEQAKTRRDMQQEEVNLLEDRQTKYTLYAPFEGYVIHKRTEVGAWISQAAPAIEMVELDPVEVTAPVPEAFIAHVRAGLEAAVRVESLESPDVLSQLPAGAYPFRGEVSHVTPLADPRSRTFAVKVVLRQPETPLKPVLKAGMLARVTLPIGPRKKITLVPKDALVLGGRAPLVFVVETDRASNALVAQPRVVTLGAAHGANYEVEGDLKAGAKVIIRGNERVRPAQPVRVIEERGG